MTVIHGDISQDLVIETLDSTIPDIPHFKEVVIMATTCDHCGHKTNEVKSGGGIEPKGTKITLRVTDPSDMSRDVLKVSIVCAFLSFFLPSSMSVPLYGTITQI